MNFAGIFYKWKLSSIKLNLKFAEVEFTSTEEDKQAAWELYVELLTRITTQALDDTAGDEKTALNSIYSIFPTTRLILKEKGRDAQTFSKIAIIVLNQIIRPFTAKWHKQSELGAFDDYARCELFRKELKDLQVDLIHYAQLLADIAEVEDLTNIGEVDI